MPDIEFDVFVDKLFNQCNKREIISKSLLYLFQAQKQSNDENKVLNKCMNIISNIVLSRKSNKENIEDTELLSIEDTESESHSAITMNNLASDLINECASYLDFTSYHLFERVNRHIYLGCNKPISLRRIPHHIFERNYKNIDDNIYIKQHLKLQKYQKITDLGIDLPSFANMPSLHKLSSSPNITSLTLSNGSASSSNKLLNSKYINIDNVSSLALENYKIETVNELLSNSGDSYADGLMNMLLKFENIEYLTLNKICYGISSALNQLIITKKSEWNTVLTNIKAFCFYGYNRDLYNLLLQHRSDQLLSLHIDDGVQSSKGFANLQELCIYQPTEQTLKNITNTATKLRRLHLEFFKNDFDGDNSTLIALLNQASLEYISIEITNDVEKLMNIIKNIDFVKRKRLKLRIYFKKKDEHSHEYFVSLREKLKHSADHYMLIFQCVLTAGMLNFVGSCKVTAAPEWIFWQSNDYSTFHKYHEKWLYPCPCNK